MQPFKRDPFKSQEENKEGTLVKYIKFSVATKLRKNQLLDTISIILFLWAFVFFILLAWCDLGCTVILMP